MSFKVKVRASLVKSLIDNRGLPLDIVALRAGVPKEDLTRYSSVDSEIGQKTLEELAKVFRKRWTVFLLDTPEMPFDFKQDNRTLANQAHGLGVELAKALEDAEFILDVSEEIGADYVVQLPAHLSINDNPSIKGEEVRSKIGVDEQYCGHVGDARELFNYWKELVQQQGIYIIERPLPLDQVRAFSLLHASKAIIALSTKDSYQARSFSLFHELCHILLRSTGVCDLSAYAAKRQEQFCNQFAAAFLAPNFLISKFLQEYKDMTDPDELVRKIAFRLKISQAATSIRLAELSVIPAVDKLDFEGLKLKGRKDSKSEGGNYYATSINAAGVQFAKQVFNAVSDGAISYRDAAHFLGVGEKNVNILRAKLYEYHPNHEHTN